MIFFSLTDLLVGVGRKLLLASAFVTTMASAYASTIPAAADIEAQNKTIVREAFEEWRAGGNLFAILLAPDVVWTIHGSDPVAGTYHSVEDFVARASAPLISRLATPLVPKLHHIWADGEMVIVRFDGSAANTSVAPYNNQFDWILRMKNDVAIQA